MNGHGTNSLNNEEGRGEKIMTEEITAERILTALEKYRDQWTHSAAPTRVTMEVEGVSISLVRSVTFGVNDRLIVWVRNRVVFDAESDSPSIFADLRRAAEENEDRGQILAEKRFRAFLEDKEKAQ
jgi:hypothetical protein